MSDFDVNPETTERVNADWLRIKKLRSLICASRRGLSHKKVPYLKNKIYDYLYDIDQFLTFWMSPFSNFITSCGYYFYNPYLSEGGSQYFYERKLIVERELVPIEENWVKEPVSGEYYYKDDGTWSANSFDGDNFSWYVKNNRRCTELWSDDDKLNFKNIVREYTKICNIDYLQYVMNHTIGWKKADRDKRIRKGESIISSIE
tara:strand:- start:539 stop:1147 length:609 start_codon:yes stop_codon:yes gene_type:complete